MKTKFELNIYNEIFNSMCANFNSILQNTILEMNQRSSDDAVINLRLDLHKRNEFVPAIDAYGNDCSKVVDAFKVEYKFGSVVQVKSECKGRVPDGYMVEYDELQKCFITRKINDTQMSLFEEEC